MPAEVKILVQGYTNADSVAETGKEKTCPTITLVKDGNLVIVVDPGILDSQQVLIDALKKENLRVEDVNIVCITHSHLDHYRNVGMFPEAKILEYYGLWNKTSVENWSENLTSDIQVLHTPGHDYTGITLFVKTSAGIVAICGDVFWKKNYPQDPKDDAYASNPGRLAESRKMILDMADWIIPGHGEIYKNDKISGAEEEEDAGLKTIRPKISVVCKKCGRKMEQKDKCFCRPYLCFNCCECGLDCDLCYCSHQRRRE
jgi:glyoxylase-like metal-dependent hydrolase (beta-lactamase superfamily II)